MFILVSCLLILLCFVIFLGKDTYAVEAVKLFDALIAVVVKGDGAVAVKLVSMVLFVLDRVVAVFKSNPCFYFVRGFVLFLKEDRSGYLVVM